MHVTKIMGLSEQAIRSSIVYGQILQACEGGIM